MSAATPTPKDSSLPPPATAALLSIHTAKQQPNPTHAQKNNPEKFETQTQKPIVLHLGDDIRWNHELYAELCQKFQIERSYSLGRDEFKAALKEKKWGDFVGMYRPFWNTGGEMGNWDEELISLLPKSCKIYASAGAGFDWVDTKTMAEHGIIYCNSAPACTESVADAAILLVLSTFRAIPWSFLAARSGSPSQFRNANQNIAAVTHNPNNHVLGIVGFGRIGYRIAQKAHMAFEMKIRYHDVVRMPKEREDSVDARWCETLEELLEGADCVVLATPFAGNVLLGREQFGRFKRGSRLVNIARGKLVDEDALVEALEQGIVSAAGLDVHADEPYVNGELAHRDNVMVLSHTAGASVESHIGFERLGMENLIGFFERGVEGAVTAVNLKWLKSTGV